MIPYPLIRSALFALDAERAHNLTLKIIARTGALGLPTVGASNGARPIACMGLEFPNRIGLAAGLDKNAEAVDGFARLGFGFIEVGTVTPKPQAGNPTPRLFRIPQREAIVNRMGFNNGGVQALLANLARSKYKGILGINIGKNATTPIEQAADDYLAALAAVYPRASYVTVNISSPNTKNLRQLQGEAELDALLSALKRDQAALAQVHGRYVPLVLKVAPDLDPAQIQHIADALRKHHIDGVIATNTTLDRAGVAGLPNADEAGGLSGAPLFERSTEVVRALHNALRGEVPIIAAGGVVDAHGAKAKIEAGASLVQIYTGLIYRGPKLIAQCIDALR